MVFSLDQALVLLNVYKYFVIFPLVVIEGPIITILSGFLSSIGHLNFLLAYVIIVMGDMTSDSLFYLMGRKSQRLPKGLMNFFGLTKGRIIYLQNQFAKSPKKIFSLGKAAHGLGPVVLFASGLSRYSFRRFFLYNLILTIIKSYLLILTGYYFGRAYASLKAYLDYGALILVVVFIILYFIFLKISAKYENPNSDR